MVRRRNNTRRRPQKRSLGTTGQLYYEYISKVTPDAGATVTDLPQSSDFKLPVDRNFKVTKVRVSASTGYAAEPRQWRVELGSTDQEYGRAASTSKLIVPLAKNVHVVNARPSSDFLYDSSGATVICGTTLFANAEITPVTLHYEIWAVIGPPTI